MIQAIEAFALIYIGLKIFVFVAELLSPNKGDIKGMK